MATLWKGLALIEPVPVEDDLCTQLALIEELGFAARFVLVQQQTCYETGQPIVVVKRKIVMPYAAARDSINMSAAFFDRRSTPPPSTVRQMRG